jgi:hypothetical protein
MHCLVFPLIIIIIIIITTLSFMKGIYTYIPETNNVPTEYNVAAILSLLCMVPISLVRVLALQFTFTLALSEVCAQCAVIIIIVVVVVLVTLLSSLLVWCHGIPSSKSNHTVNVEQTL